MGIFYVYEHYRQDTGVCFYVGKGQGKRAWELCRGYNPRYHRVIQKLSGLGLAVDIRIVQDGLDEDAAFILEKERIAFWKATGELTNLTDGGEGISNPSEETRQKLQKASKLREAEKKANGWRHATETRLKMSTAHKGRQDPEEVKEKKRKVALQRPPMSEEVRAAIAAKVKDLWANPEYRERLVQAHEGYVPTDTARANMRRGQAKRGPTRPKEHRDNMKWSDERRKSFIEKTTGQFRPSQSASMKISHAQRSAEDRARVGAKISEALKQSYARRRAEAEAK